MVKEKKGVGRLCITVTDAINTPVSIFFPSRVSMLSVPDVVKQSRWWEKKCALDNASCGSLPGLGNDTGSGTAGSGRADAGRFN